MSRESVLVHALVDLADTLVEDFDVVDVLTEMATRCAEVLGVAAVGVMLASPGGELQVVASSTESMRVLELLELQANEGPCLDAFHTKDQVEQLSLPDQIERWPRFAPAAIEAGYVSVFALPLRLRRQTIGALNLFDTEPGGLDDQELEVAQAFADLATISILTNRSAIESQRLITQLGEALTSRILIEQAKGVIAERAGIDMAEAFNRLRGYARSHNQLLSEVAQAAIDNTLDPSL